ncbi:hypothetical protein QY97_02846 [Bacillus thermotolerans]|uniref:Uncharacterized protein n=1 Tax=Bacillus thermotolerans TaxID=1221996 RepID=A0A0F5I3K4_BACTR|nr:hypothetical protein QY97_02846 [Bacillus thermotolerans]KKB39860.1 hypothetical protein QY95_02077 [Bacillus thermotolerans]KKB44297.1 hypothetical protein QY96_03319 [Bacillus thermotolerans]
MERPVENLTLFPSHSNQKTSFWKERQALLLSLTPFHNEPTSLSACLRKQGEY